MVPRWVTLRDQEERFRVITCYIRLEFMRTISAGIGTEIQRYKSADFSYVTQVVIKPYLDRLVC